MNKELKDNVYKVPNDVIKTINHAVTVYGEESPKGMERAKNILKTKTVTYKQLKRIVHDLDNIDKHNDHIKYNLYGGDAMDKWAKTFLNLERKLVSDKKDISKKANDSIGLDTVRKNTHNKTHTRKFGFKTPTNLLKSNSQKSYISSMKALNLINEITHIKNLIQHG